MSVKFDFIVNATTDTRLVLEYLNPLAPLRQICIGVGECFARSDGIYEDPNNVAIPAGGQATVRRLMERHANQLARKHQGVSFPFLRQPEELQSMILSYMVVEKAMVPLKDCRSPPSTIRRMQDAAVDIVEDSQPIAMRTVAAPM
jgi:hypothetical protein